MTLMQVLVGFDPVTKKPITVSQHRFLVFGGRPKMDHTFTRYEKVDERMRHVRYRAATRNVIVMHRKGGPRPERFPASFNLHASTSRQVRRQLDRMPRLVEQR